MTLATAPGGARRSRSSSDLDPSQGARRVCENGSVTPIDATLRHVENETTRVFRGDRFHDSRPEVSRPRPRRAARVHGGARRGGGGAASGIEALQCRGTTRASTSSWSTWTDDEQGRARALGELHAAARSRSEGGRRLVASRCTTASWHTPHGPTRCTTWSPPSGRSSER